MSTNSPSIAAMTIEELQSRCLQLEEQCSQLEQQNAELTAKLNWFMEQLRLSLGFPANGLKLYQSN